MKQRAFTLIELLVVVAIIGIIAAVGVVAYSGYTSAAKKSASISNHNTIVKYISTEIRKCDIGESSIMNNKVSCTEIAVYNKIAKAVALSNTFCLLQKNCFDTITNQLLKKYLMRHIPSEFYLIIIND